MRLFSWPSQPYFQPIKEPLTAHHSEQQTNMSNKDSELALGRFLGKETFRHKVCQHFKKFLFVIILSWIPCAFIRKDGRSVFKYVSEIIFYKWINLPCYGHRAIHVWASEISHVWTFLTRDSRAHLIQLYDPQKIGITFNIFLDNIDTP